jgi:hypothetical protein
MKIGVMYTMKPGKGRGQLQAVFDDTFENLKDNSPKKVIRRRDHSKS